MTWTGTDLGEYVPDACPLPYWRRPMIFWFLSAFRPCATYNQFDLIHLSDWKQRFLNKCFFFSFFCLAWFPVLLRYWLVVGQVDAKENVSESWLILQNRSHSVALLCFHWSLNDQSTDFILPFAKNMCSVHKIFQNQSGFRHIFFGVYLAYD